MSGWDFLRALQKLGKATRMGLGFILFFGLPGLDFPMERVRNLFFGDDRGEGEEPASGKALVLLQLGGGGVCVCVCRGVVSRPPDPGLSSKRPGLGRSPRPLTSHLS